MKAKERSREPLARSRIKSNAESPEIYIPWFFTPLRYILALLASCIKHKPSVQWEEADRLGLA